MPISDSVYRKGIKYLLRTQAADGLVARQVTLDLGAAIL